MSLTNAQKRKQAKKKNREKHIRHMANLRNNQPYMFRLDVEVDGQWIPGVMKFRKWSQVLTHQDVTERRRAVGEEIAPGKVVSLVNEKVVLEIAGSKVKGVAPDTITNGSKANPNVTAFKTPEQRAEEAIARLESVVESDDVTEKTAK